MPQQHRTAVRAGLAPVPVPVSFFPHRSVHRRPETTVTGPLPATKTNWCGVRAAEVAHLIHGFTRPRDVVVDLDGHPLITSAARFLGRQAARLRTEGDSRRLRQVPPARRVFGCRDGAGLVTVRLPRAGVDSRDLYALTCAMQSWRTLLRPGGFLLVALTAAARETGAVSPRSTAITAARAAGLSWQQEFVVALRPLPEYEPRAMPDTAATTPPALIDGHHDVVHLRLLAFQNMAGGRDA